MESVGERGFYIFGENGKVEGKGVTYFKRRMEKKDGVKARAI